MTPVVTVLMMVVSLDVPCTRTVTTPRSIERTMIRIGVGLVSSYGSEKNLTDLCKALEGSNDGIEIHDSRILIDGERNGHSICRIVRGIAKIGSFVLDRSDPGESVELRYTIIYRGLSIDRWVFVSEGQILSHASFTCKMGPQGRLRGIRIYSSARESASGTTIRSTVTAVVNSGICRTRRVSRIRIVNDAVRGIVHDRLDGSMKSIESNARRLSNLGHDVLIGSLFRLVDDLIGS